MHILKSLSVSEFFHSGQKDVRRCRRHFRRILGRSWAFLTLLLATCRSLFHCLSRPKKKTTVCNNPKLSFEIHFRICELLFFVPHQGCSGGRSRPPVSVPTTDSGDGTQIKTRETVWFQAGILKEERADLKTTIQQFNTEAKLAWLRRMMGYTGPLS